VLIYGSINDLVPAFEWQKCLLNAWMLGEQIVDELLVGDDCGAIRRAAVWKCRRVDATRHDGEGNAEAQCDVYDSFGGLITVHADEKRWLSIGEEVADAGFATPHVVADVRKRRHVRFIIVILCMQLRGVTNDSGNLTREYILRRLGELSGIGGSVYAISRLVCMRMRSSRCSSAQATHISLRNQDARAVDAESGLAPRRRKLFHVARCRGESDTHRGSTSIAPMPCVT
jgi:hypothetical protein